jgi:Mg-chelatase subunit ChlD
MRTSSISFFEGWLTMNVRFFRTSVFALASFMLMHSLVSGANIITARTIDTVGSSAGGDTMLVTISFFAEGSYDTLYQIDTTYDTVPKPSDVLMALDNSSARTTQGTLSQAKASAQGFIDSLNDIDRVGFMVYGEWDSLQLINELAPSENFQDVKDSIDIRLDGTGHSTAVWYAALKSAQHMVANKRPEAEPVVILLADGNDDCSGPSCHADNDGGANMGATSEEAHDSLMRYLETVKGEVKIFTVSLGPSSDVDRMAMIADSTGGQYFIAKDENDLDSIYALIAQMMVVTEVAISYTTTRIPVIQDTLQSPIDVALVLDNSSSMRNDGRIYAARQASATFIDALKGRDQVAALIYSAWTDLDTIVSLVDSSGFGAAISTISVELDGIGRGTAAWYSALKGIEYILSNARTGAVPVVVFMSDGADNCSGATCFRIATGANMGTTSDDAADSLIRYINSVSEDLQVFTVSLGSETNQDYMQAIADAGNGAWLMAGTSQELDSVYKLISNLIIRNVGARNVSIEEKLYSDHVLVPGSIVLGPNNTAKIDTAYVTDDGYNTSLTWHVEILPVWGTIEVGYKVFIPSTSTMKNLDSALVTTITCEDDNFNIYEEKWSKEAPTVSDRPAAENARSSFRAFYSSRSGTMTIRQSPAISHGPIDVRIYNMAGRTVRSAAFAAGDHDILFKAQLQSGGIYYIAITGAKGTVVQKLVCTEQGGR